MFLRLVTNQELFRSTNLVLLGNSESLKKTRKYQEGAGELPFGNLRSLSLLFLTKKFFPLK